MPRADYNVYFQSKDTIQIQEFLYSSSCDLSKRLTAYLPVSWRGAIHYWLLWMRKWQKRKGKAGGVLEEELDFLTVLAFRTLQEQQTMLCSGQGGGGGGHRKRKIERRQRQNNCKLLPPCFQMKVLRRQTHDHSRFFHCLHFIENVNSFDEWVVKDLVHNVISDLNACLWQTASSSTLHAYQQIPAYKGSRLILNIISQWEAVEPLGG